MTSELVPANPLRLKQWEACKRRILDKVAELATIQGKAIIDMIPDLRIIKENQLWKYGGYRSFQEFCNKALGVSRQYVYRVLSVNQDARKVLEMNDAISNQLTSGVLDGLSLCAPSEPEKETEPPPQKSLNDPPKSAPKGRKTKPAPEPIEATFTEPVNARAAVSAMSDQEVDALASNGMKRAGVCPHCGGAI